MAVVAGSKKKVGGVKARPKLKGRAPAARKKKVGGVKTRSKVKARAPAARPKKKKVGGVTFQITEAASSKHRYCAVGCEGEWREGMWCHDNNCSELRMTWKTHGQTLADWTCYYGCPGQEMPSGWTHHAECLFWHLRPQLTPFHTAGEERKENLKSRDTMQGLLDLVPMKG